MFTRLDVEKYFTSEKNLSILFIILGSIGIITAIVFFLSLKTSIYKGIAIPLLVIAIIQLIAGISVYKRTDMQRKDIVYKLDMNFSEIKEKEIPRIETVVKSFKIYRFVEVALFIIGLVLILMYKNNVDKSSIFGIGIGLAIQAAIMFAGDSFAAKNAKVYSEGLKAYKSTNMHL